MLYGPHQYFNRTDIYSARGIAREVWFPGRRFAAGTDGRLIERSAFCCGSFVVSPPLTLRYSLRIVLVNPRKTTTVCT